MASDLTAVQIGNIKAAIAKVEGGEPYEPVLERLAGDASDRRYYRALYIVHKKSKSMIIMDIRDVENICKSEEVTLYHDPEGELPFINIQRFLKSIGAPVPEIHYFNREKGLMLLSDLGDRLLLDEAMKDNGAERKHLYQQAVDELVDLQVKSETKREGSDCIAFTQTFAADLLEWEFNHYVEYGIEALHGVTIAPDDREVMNAEFKRIAKHIANLPKTFTHRDYHSRNLQLFEGRLYMIDFQDALYGPHQYDLASLIRDSYIDLGDHLRDELISYYLDRYAKDSGAGFEAGPFRKNFDMVAMQRNLKAAGRFVFIDKEKGNPNYLDSIPRTLSYVAGDLKRNTELSKLRDVLVKYEPRLEG